MTFTDFAEIPRLRYRLIMADPPWRFALRSSKGEKKSAQAKYATMSLDEIKALPVGHLAHGDCWLWLWCTNPLLRKGFDVLDAWGARYVTGGHWSKKTKNGKQAFGPGYVFRTAGEPYLLGAWGKPRPYSRSIRSVIEGLAREHSRKPEESFAAAEMLTEGPYLELFSRTERPGWDTFGDEAGTWSATPEALVAAPQDVADGADRGEGQEIRV